MQLVEQFENIRKNSKIEFEIEDSKHKRRSRSNPNLKSELRNNIERL